jgi:hypothetical protein
MNAPTSYPPHRSTGVAAPLDSGPDLTEMGDWGAPRRKRAEPKPAKMKRLWAKLKQGFHVMLQGSQDRQGVRGWWGEMVQEAPAWLVSVFVHFGMVVVLGLCAVGVQQKIAEKMEVAVAPDYSFSDGDLGETLGSGLDEGAPGLLAEEFNPMLPPTPTISDIPSDSDALAGALTDLDSDWQEMLTAADGNPSLVSGMGDSPFGGNGGRGNGGGGNGVTSMFGLSGEGGKFVYVFDHSESMNSVFSLYSNQQLLSTITPLHSAKAELKRSLGSLGRGNHFQIVLYNDEVELFGSHYYEDKELYPATAELKQEASEYVDAKKGEGFTNHILALETALQLKPDVIFLLTDGEAKDDLLPNQVRKLERYCRHNKILINVVHFCNAPRENCTLVRLAERTGGQHVFISLESLAEAMIKPGAAQGPAAASDGPAL